VGIPTGFSVGVGWVWGLKSNPAAAVIKTNVWSNVLAASDGSEQLNAAITWLIGSSDSSWITRVRKVV